MQNYIHGWAVFFHCYHIQRRKRHGGGRPTIWQAVFFARCARFVAAQQHRPELSPYTCGLLGD